MCLRVSVCVCCVCGVCVHQAAFYSPSSSFLVLSSPREEEEKEKGAPKVLSKFLCPHCRVSEVKVS